MRQSTCILVTLLSSISSIYAQTAQPDGVIVPFTSDLPACASLCGPLFDVQGACTPPVTQSVDDNCFCTDARLKPFDTLGTAGVSQVCGAASCSAQSDLSAIKSWYDDFCHTSTATTTSSSTGATSTSTSGSSGGSSSGSTGSSSGNKSWLATHYRWVIMLVVVFFLIVAGWIGACILRKRYILRKEKEFEMRPPVAWGPHQLQGMTGGYNYGDGVRDAPRGGAGQGPYNKEMPAVAATPANATKGKRESRALRKSRQ